MTSCPPPLLGKRERLGYHVAKGYLTSSGSGREQRGTEETEDNSYFLDTCHTGRRNHYSTLVEREVSVLAFVLG